MREGRLILGLDPLGGHAQQFPEHDAFHRQIRYRAGRPIAGRDLADRGDSVTEAFDDSAPNGLRPLGEILRVPRATVLDDHGDPIREPHSGLAQRGIESAELQMRVRVDQSRKNRHVPQVYRVDVASIRPDVPEMLPGDHYDAIADGGRIDGKNPAGAKSPDGRRWGCHVVESVRYQMRMN